MALRMLKEKLIMENMKQKNELVFIVDDDEVYHSLLRTILKVRGFTNIESYYSGEECIDALKDKSPVYVFLDYNMNGINGVATLEKIKEKNSNSKVIMISGQEKIDVVLSSLKTGAFDYIVKDRNVCKKINYLLQYIGNNSDYQHINNIQPVVA
jgi:DNA-binding NtrC family response regulator